MGNQNGIIIENLDSKYTVMVVYCYDNTKTTVPSINKYYLVGNGDAPVEITVKNRRKVIATLTIIPEYSGDELIQVRGSKIDIGKHRIRLMVGQHGDNVSGEIQ